MKNKVEISGLVRKVETTDRSYRIQIESSYETYQEPFGSVTRAFWFSIFVLKSSIELMKEGDICEVSGPLTSSKGKDGRWYTNIRPDTVKVIPCTEVKIRKKSAS